MYGFHGIPTSINASRESSLSGVKFSIKHKFLSKSSLFSDHILKEGMQSTQMVLFPQCSAIAFTLNDIGHKMFTFGKTSGNPRRFVLTRTVLTILPKYFRHKAENYLLSLKTNKKLQAFRKNSCSSKCFSGHIECSFHNPTEAFSLKVRN